MPLKAGRWHVITSTAKGCAEDSVLPIKTIEPVVLIVHFIWIVATVLIDSATILTQ